MKSGRMKKQNIKEKKLYGITIQNLLLAKNT